MNDSLPDKTNESDNEIANEPEHKKNSLEETQTESSVESGKLDLRFQAYNEDLVICGSKGSGKSYLANELLKSFGNIHVKILMHSLAFGALKPVVNGLVKNIIQQRQIEMTLDVMASSIIYWTQDLFQSGLLKRGSQIFAMTSAGSHVQWKSYGAVSMAKAALESAIRQLAVELAPYEIAANSIQAGVTDTEALRKIPGSENMIKNAQILNPHKRLTRTSDIGDFIEILTQYESSWMTGNIIRLDGGEDITT